MDAFGLRNLDTMQLEIKSPHKKQHGTRLFKWYKGASGSPHTRYDFKAMRQHSSFDQHILCTNHEVTKVMLVSCFLFSLVQSWTNRYVQLQWRLHVDYDYNTHISHWWNCATATFCGWQWIATWQSSKQMSTASVTPALLGCDFHQGLFKIGINFNGRCPFLTWLWHTSNSCTVWWRSGDDWREGD